MLVANLQDCLDEPVRILKRFVSRVAQNHEFCDCVIGGIRMSAISPNFSALYYSAATVPYR